MSAAPIVSITPSCSSSARSQTSVTVGMLWVTSRIVRPSRCICSKTCDALLLEVGVADREHLVDEQQVGVDVGHHRESEPHLHPR